MVSFSRSIIRLPHHSIFGFLFVRQSVIVSATGTLHIHNRTPVISFSLYDATTEEEEGQVQCTFLIFDRFVESVD